MVKRLLLILGLASSLCSAEQTKTVFNPHTGAPDFITKVTSTTLGSYASLSPSQCVQTDINGALQSSGGSCGGGGGGTSSLQVTNSGVQITSPTASLNFNSQGFILGAVGSTSTIALNPATTDFIHNQSSLQSGATFYVSSGTVKGQLTSTSIVTSSQVFINAVGPSMIAQCVEVGLAGPVTPTCDQADIGFNSNAAYFAFLGDAAVNNSKSYGTYIENNMSTFGAAGATYGGFFYAANGTTNNYGISTQVETVGATANAYGGQFLVNTSHVGNTNYGIYAQAQGAAGSSNYAGYFSAPNSANSAGVYIDATNHAIQINAGDIAVQGGAGTSGQFLQSQGSNTTPIWASVAGGEIPALAISTGTTSFSSPISSPTANLVFDSANHKGTVIGGTTAFITLDPSSVTLRGTAWATSVDSSTGTLTTNLFATSSSTGTIMSRVVNVGTDTGTITSNLFLTSTSTGTIMSRVVNVGTDTGTITSNLFLTSSSTGTLAARLVSVGISTAAIAVDTGTIMARVVSVGTDTGTITSRLVNVGTDTGTISAKFPVDLSGANATGILAAARFPALTGDITTVSGALATTAATTQGNIKTFTQPITITSSLTVNSSAAVNSVAINLTAQTNVSTGTSLTLNTNGVLVSTSGVKELIITATQNLNAPAWGRLMRVMLCGPGGGGGGGSGAATSNIRTGSAGGGGGACIIKEIDLTKTSYTFGITIGSGTPGASGGVTAVGSTATQATASYFYQVGGSTFIFAGGGGGGAASISSGTSGGSGGGGCGNGPNGANANGIASCPGIAVNSGFGTAGAGTVLGSVGLPSDWGGASGGGGVTFSSVTASSGGVSVFGGSGGGAGGSCTAANACVAGGSGGSLLGNNFTVIPVISGGGGTNGTSTGFACTGGGNGAAGNEQSGGAGGGGGGANSSGTGCTGGNGGVCGGGGGGGGAGTSTGGAGGTGGNGCAFIWVY